ncbi:RNA polymerase sigma factor, sigma-70 family [Bernardetia litoralis DSM 6794]|uniref:RNA polymerase sigma factor n=1 Tax=Bernardetia litoralis (strain ATCC 23117 / DSM 6794 / NBRC 15988 / NCIMB 1366 / Fx l1 / Sio-4) TaxID=880071 RepID=I4AJG7_BERLS|nr:sigma-70 family RNA polymerase sigma factor [Bernardetia litoralis]AFM04102.1 RNA polymerase sigma factor, sigma-70 family [Bernardetia litoralis DSM 6794]
MSNPTVDTNYEEPNAELIEKVRLGSQKAQYQLYEKYVRAMYHVCVRIVGKGHEAEEVLQDSFVRAFMRIEEYRGDAAFGAWLKRIVINTSINFLQKKKIDLVSLDEMLVEPAFEDDCENDFAEINIHTGISEKNIKHNSEVSRVKEAINKLSDGYRIVLSLYLFEGYDHQEIGEILGISSSTSKSQYSRAKKRLRTML